MIFWLPMVILKVIGFHQGIMKLAMEPSLLGTALMEGGPDRKIKLDHSPGVDEVKSAICISGKTIGVNFFYHWECPIFVNVDCRKSFLIFFSCFSYEFGLIV